ncbi:MAG: DNA methyltransferase [Candidatus Poribacteria bacterium]|nr:DNA methyltransferase [Candidatus Poribacteria bacterium]
MSSSNLKYKDESWDFRTADTKEYTHCFHTYPAMMIPQIARRLLNQYGVEGEWLLDPYCGTGTSLVEATLFGMHSVGCDINPLVRLIATTKLTPILLKTLDTELNKLNDILFQVEFRAGKAPEVPIPKIPNLNYWFSQEVIKSLAYLVNCINKIEDQAVRNFITVAFSETVREVSYTRTSTFKLHRMPAEKLENFNPDVFGIFRKKLNRNRQGLAAYLEKRKDVETSVCDTNTANGELPMPRPLGGYNLVITSPPYGDSHTTVAYGQFSRLSAEWLGLPNARKIDRLAMGGQNSRETLVDTPVSSAIDKIRSIDEKRALEVAAFYIDLERSISSVVKTLSPRSTICYVVGNRRVKDIRLPTDEFVIFAFGKHGFSHKETIVRNIPNKRMPLKNSPSNVPGQTSTTMHEENIVICQRTDQTCP